MSPFLFHGSYNSLYLCQYCTNSCYTGFFKDRVQNLLPTSAPATIQGSMSWEMRDIVPGSPVRSQNLRKRDKKIAHSRRLFLSCSGE